MRITFSRTGGFAGVKLAATFEPGRLSAEVIVEIEQLAQQADFFALPPQIASSSGSADRFVYCLTIEDTGRSHSVQVGEGAAPESLKPLLHRLLDLVRGGQGH